MKDEIRLRKKYKELFSDNIEYNILIHNYDKRDVDGLLNIMLDAACSKRDFLIVGCDEIPQEVVKSRLLELNYTHIEYVLECLKKNTTKVRNIKSYLLTALFNSLLTIEHVYGFKV